MVNLSVNRYFDTRFIQFGFTALILKIIVYYIQSHMNRNMIFTKPNTVFIRKGNSSAKIHLFGATITSWIVDGQEVLYVSKHASYEGSRAIRGGVPIVFPQFGAWKDGPQHGFARISDWSLKDEDNIGTDSITLVLEDTDSTRQLWNYRFRLEYTITILNNKKIMMEALIINSGDDALPFTFLFHTYFSVPDVLFCKVSGLAGCTYIDKVQNGESLKEERSQITVSEFTDRIYFNTPMVHKITNVSGKRSITIKKSNLPDTVIWNPWIENAKSMSDFGDNDWKRMICVEPGIVNTPIVLAPKKSFSASQILTVD